MLWLWIVLLIFVVHGLILSLFVLLEHRHPAATVAWILALVFLPFFGALSYYLFGRSRFFRRKRSRAKSLEELRGKQGAQGREVTVAGKGGGAQEAGSTRERENTGEAEEGEAWESEVILPSMEASLESQRIELSEEQRGSEPMARLAARVVGSPVKRGNQTKILHNGDETFAAIAAAMEGAKDHIHLCYYIYRDDATGRWIRDLLVEKAKAGVEVRLLVDGIGSYGLSKAFQAPLLEAGGKIGVFLPLRWAFRRDKTQFNFRNHRKTVIVDGNIGLTGGLNVGDEYRSLDARVGFWRDTHIEIKGSAVAILQDVFAEDWYFSTGEALHKESYFPSFSKQKNGECMQIISSGPDQSWFSLHLIFFTAITTAVEKVWITTPYFVPSDAIITALKAAALRGVDVRLLLPHKSDQKIVLYAGRSYYRDLLRAGVRIYEYQRGILHSKTMVVDGRCATIGSANMDIRSFQLNFELNAFVYSRERANSLEEHFLQDTADSVEIDLISYLRRPLTQKLAEASARLLSPLL